MILSEFNPDCGLCVAKMFGLSFQKNWFHAPKSQPPYPPKPHDFKKGTKESVVVVLVVEFKTSKKQPYILQLENGN